MSEPPSLSREPAERHALIVDDHQDSAQGLALMLEALGYKTEIAANGIEALRKATASQPGLVLLDIGMPKLDGYDTCGVIRAQPWAGKTRIIAVTGKSWEEVQERSESAGFDDCLVKPVDFSTLEKALAAA